MTTLTKERVKQYADEPLMCVSDEVREMARMLLASMESCRAQKAAGEWIPIGERLPPDESVVLVCDGEGIVWCAEVDGGQIYPDEFPNACMRSSDVTHWMVMPVAPKESDRE